MRKGGYMPKLNMQGSYSFDEETINNVITRTSAGNYALGYINENDRFVPLYVGRADSDVRGRLLQHLGENYSRFKFSYATSPKAAFEKECQNYHDFNPRDNKIHPDRPSNSKEWKCPVCDKLYK